MATATPLTHPDESEQSADFYPYKAEFKILNTSGKYEHAFFSPCAYQARPSGSPETFELEAPVGDLILLPEWHPECAPEQLVVLTFPGGTERRFVVTDAAPDGEGTLVGVTPK